MQQLRPVIRQISGNMFIFQPDSAPAHCDGKTIQLLCQDTLDFISARSPNSPDLNPVDYKILTNVRCSIY